MTDRRDNSTRKAASIGTALSRLQPVDTAPFKRPAGLVFLWFTIIFTWLLSLLQWRQWEPAPDLLMLVLVFWTLNEPRRVSLMTAFVFGLLMDVHDGTLLGGQALAYTLATYGALLLARRLLHFNALVQAIHMLPIFMLAEGVSRLILAWLSGGWAGWGWTWSMLFTVALWPLADILLHMPQRRLDGSDAGAV